MSWQHHVALQYLAGFVAGGSAGRVSQLTRASQRIGHGRPFSPDVQRVAYSLQSSIPVQEEQIK
jgi:hypothetical protein